MSILTAEAGPVPLFVELCCGSAAVTLRLIGGSNARPPISYMGAKTGYAGAILHALGLRAGQGAATCVLVEAGPWAKAWRLLTTPEGCRAVASVIRGWIGEDARALWERLRATPVTENENEVAAWLVSDAWTKFGRYQGPDRPSAIHPEGWTASITLRGMANSSTALSILHWPMVQVVEGDVAGVDPADIARWLVVQYLRRPGDGGFKASAGGSWPDSPPDLGNLRFADSWPLTVVAYCDVTQVQPGTLPPGTVVYFDPPYQGTTGYQHSLSRSDVLSVANRWSDAGAIVAVSEAEPLALPGWHHVELTGARVGQKRTFSKQQVEWLTMNREPATVPMRQKELW